MKWLKEKGLLVLFVALAMALTVMPMVAGAEEGAPWDEGGFEHSPGNGSEVVNRKVRISSSLDGNITIGEVFTLKATLQGFENCSYKAVWEYHDGVQWNSVDGDESLRLDVIATEQTIEYKWRLVVTTV